MAKFKVFYKVEENKPKKEVIIEADRLALTGEFVRFENGDLLSSSEIVAIVQSYYVDRVEKLKE